ncbi:TonB-linked SusC/RagA family outer membrane protein [Mariniflexile fucanivorans]|uniref:TonB-linked SusC/RagA family outer membrane protein n=1 Tax=Mariniflexile fucanivorans TaxID=264023 RepID=A0A4R1RNL1_9FLAO|nr:TonB-dependent receptor [Mariniflexile fucanivorans]TCL67903.1 TonB-linked SusC/RagA family outer membrane protein [Mariniflexile fucanivorans]
MKQILTAFIFMISVAVFSQNKTITGKITDGTGQPLAGANIIEKGTSNGALSDFDGNFSIKVAGQNSILVVSYIGFVNQQIPVQGKNTINIILKEDLAALDEVVVIGYGTVKKKDLVGSVSVVDTKEAFLTPVSNPQNALQGRASGVQVTSSNGSPGSAPEIIIRGGNSITGGNDPLYVIDGFVGADNIASLNPNDIESMQVLKDASSTAIYGARGTNGVIIITTKKGKIGKPVVNFRASSGIQTLPKEIDVQSTRELATWFNNIAPDQTNLPFDLNDLPATDTNWQKELIREAVLSDYQLSVSGGTEAVKYYVSGGVLTQDGIVKGSGFDRYSLRSNIDFKLSKTFKAGLNLSLSRTDKDNNVVSFTQLLREDPSKPVYDDEGNYWIGTNPILGSKTGHLLADALLDDDTTTLDKIFINTYIQGDFFDNKLTWKSTFGGDFVYNKRHRFTPSTNPSYIMDGNKLARAIINRSNNQEFLNENTLNYTETFGDHSLNILAGASFQTQNSESVQITAADIPSDGVNVYAVQLAPAESVGITSDYSEIHQLGVFGRVNYIYKDRYIFNASLRRDGKSSLGINEKYANFPSASIGWKVKEESFLKDVDAINDLKLRVNYGRTGNSGVAAFNTIANYNIDNNTIIVNGVVVPGVTQGEIAKPNLGWEITDQYDAGLEFSLFNRRLSAEVDVYYKETTDLLLAENTVDFTGVTTLLTNIGAVKNRGVDVTLNGKIVKTDNFKWDVSLSVSTFKNEVLDLGQSTFLSTNNLGAPATDEASRLMVGQPVGIFWGAKYLGFDPTTGDAIFEDISGPDGVPDGIYSEEYDDQIIGNANPDFFGGLQTNFTYKNFDLSAFFAFSVGNENYSEEFFRVNEISANSFASIRNNMWSVNNTENAKYPAFNSDNYDLSSSLYVQDASYLRLSTLQLGYNLPKDLISGFDKLRVYFTGTNLFLVKSKDYVGFDPDVSTGVANKLQRGFDGIAYPQNRSLLIGIDVSF